METEFEIAVVGAGPLGIEMAVGLKRAGLSYVHLEGGQIGATMQWWAAGTRWFSSNERISIAGVPLVTPQQEKATREEYLAYLRAVVEQFELPIETYMRVMTIERAGREFLIGARRSVGGKAAGGEKTFRVKKLILCTGGTERANVLGIPGEDLPHVSHYFQDPHSYFRREVLIVGGRNSAVEAALRCYRAGARVSFCYRGEGVDVKDIKYWLYPEFSGLTKVGKIRAYYGMTPAAIRESEVVLAPCAQGREVAGERVTVPADFVLLMTGYVADLSLAVMAGVELTGEQGVPTYDAVTMETNVPGLYVAGTAIAGTQRRYRVFLENCINIHTSRILAHFMAKGMISSMPAGFSVNSSKPPNALPES